MAENARLLARATARRLAAALLLGASGTHAADQLILGKKLLIKRGGAGLRVSPGT